jgi:glycosyltransferase involved in cell wall biosynthesis
MKEIHEGDLRPNPRVEIVLPVLNERAVLECSVATLAGYLGHHCPYPWQIMIADNGSTDGTWEIAQRLTAAYENVHALRLEERGRGLALRTAWLQSDAEIVAYMDIDLSTGLEAFLPMIAPLVSGQRRVAIGSRLLPDAQVTRGAKREAISRCYNALIHLLVPHRFSDAQCGFKALHRAAVRELVPLVENNRWFFDTELLLAAEERGECVHEVPVRWVEDTDTRVHIGKTAWEDVRGLLRVRMQRWQRRFATIHQGHTALPAHE